MASRRDATRSRYSARVYWRFMRRSTASEPDWTGRCRAGTTAGGVRHRRDEAGGKIARVGRHEAQAPESRQRADRAQEIGEILAGLRITERVHGLSEELDLQGPLAEQAAGLVHDVAQPAIALAPARAGNDAERAVLVAALDDRDRGAVRHRARDRAGRVDDLVRVEARLTGPVVLFLDAAQDRRQGLDASRPEHEVDLRQALEKSLPFLLRDAAADAEHGIRAFALQLREASEAVVDLLLGLVANRARVEENDAGFFGRRRFGESLASEKSDEAPPVENVHLAAPRLHEDASGLAVEREARSRRELSRSAGSAYRSQPGGAFDLRASSERSSKALRASSSS